MDVPELVIKAMPGFLGAMAERCMKCNTPNQPIESKPGDSPEMKEKMKRQKFYQSCGKCGLIAYCSKECQVFFKLNSNYFII